MNIQMQMPERVQNEDTGSQFHGRFILQPLEQGYGVTIGNSLRRVLLSSIPGSAIIGVKITDVTHEFQTVQGVVEDVSEIILNLKKVRMKMNDKKATKVIFHVKGPGTWTAKDIELAAPDAVEVIDPDHHICTLSDDAEFDVELRIGKGKGYVPGDEQSIVDFPLGMLPIDSIHTPVKNVVYTVEPFRVGQKTDYEKLILDLTTDGTISAQEAVHFASKVLNEHIKFFINFDKYEEDAQPHMAEEEEIKVAERNRIRKILLTPVDELELSVRAHNCLKSANIKNLAELVNLQESELLKFRNFGKKSLTELAEVVASFGLDFGMNIEPYLRDEPKSLHID